MSKIFISHASHNNQAALSLRDWLLNNGFDQVFLDLDPETGIKVCIPVKPATHSTRSLPPKPVKAATPSERSDAGVLVLL